MPRDLIPGEETSAWHLVNYLEGVRFCSYGVSGRGHPVLQGETEVGQSHPEWGNLPWYE